MLSFPNDPIDADADERDDLGWHVIGGTHLLETLRRVERGENADLVFAELWANGEREEPE